MRFSLLLVFGGLFATTVITATTEPISLAVQVVRPFGDNRGILTVSDDGLAFEAHDTEKSRCWTFDAIRSIAISSPVQIVLSTYEPTKQLLVVPALRTHTFRVVEGSVTPEFVAGLLVSFPRPVLTTVLPVIGDPMWRGEAWHDQHRSGHDGVLELHPGGLIFRASTPMANRYWRFQDIVSVLRLEANRIEVAVRESDQTKPYVFELKNDLPEPTFDAIWRSLHPAADWTHGLTP